MTAPSAKTKLRITLCHDGLGEPWLSRICDVCSAWATVEMAPEKSQRARAQVLASDIVVGWPEAAPLREGRARFFQCGSTGYEAYAGQGLEEKAGFRMSNAAGTMSIPVAEHGIAFMLAGARNLWRHAQHQVDRRYERAERYREVAGTTACICGLGGIGSELAQRCRGLGMRVVGVRREAGKPHPLAETVFPLDQLADAVREADHVFIVLPLDAQTRGCFNARIFNAMMPGAALYSLARGALIDEGDLIAAVREGRVGFAGLDVFNQEPLSADSPLWSEPNIMITPHCSGRSEHEFRRMAELVIDNLKRLNRGEEPRNLVINNPDA